MKKFDLVHTTILIVALMMGYAAITQLFGILIAISYVTVSYRQEGIGGVIFYDLVAVLLFSIASIVLLKKGRAYAAMILKNEPENLLEDALQLNIDRPTLIFVLLIGMGLYTLLQAIPYLILNLYELFQNKVAMTSFKEGQPSRDKMIIQVLEVTVGAFLIYAAPTFTRLIENHVALPKHD